MVCLFRAVERERETHRSFEHGGRLGRHFQFAATARHSHICVCRAQLEDEACTLNSETTFVTDTIGLVAIEFELTALQRIVAGLSTCHQNLSMNDVSARQS
jgi:hypothetical protein